MNVNGTEQKTRHSKTNKKSKTRRVYTYWKKFSLFLIIKMRNLISKSTLPYTT